jgi:hypothetical protein
MTTESSPELSRRRRRPAEADRSIVFTRSDEIPEPQRQFESNTASVLYQIDLSMLHSRDCPSTSAVRTGLTPLVVSLSDHQLFTTVQYLIGNISVVGNLGPIL